MNYIYLKKNWTSLHIDATDIIIPIHIWLGSESV